MHRTFLDSLQPTVQTLTCEVIGHFLLASNLDALHQALWKNICTVWYETGTGSLDVHERVENIVSTSLSVLSAGLVQKQGGSPSSMYSIATLETWRHRMVVAMNEHYRAKFFEEQNTADYLGQGSRKIYNFVREELKVPFHRGVVEYPGIGKAERGKKMMVGGWVGVIYGSLRDGRLFEQVMMDLEFDNGGTVNGVANGTNGVTNGSTHVAFTNN
jgi:phenylalanine ammonia-lyase